MFRFDGVSGSLLCSNFLKNLVVDMLLLKSRSDLFCMLQVRWRIQLCQELAIDLDILQQPVVRISDNHSTSYNVLQFSNSGIPKLLLDIIISCIRSTMQQKR